ncbi:FlgO family outer membrane protein [Caldithrix abyssi]
MPEKPLPPTNTEANNMNLVGERLSIAVLPFSSQGIGTELQDIDFLDKLITGFVNSGRFKVIERAQLERILEEQKLGLSGIIDPTTAAEIGKGIGVDAVILGSVTRAGNSLSIDARLIDTENATIISAQDAYSNKLSIYQIAEMVNQLAEKFKKDLPIVQGLVINVQRNRITLDIGLNKGLKKGMKCLVYREGDPIVHPVTKEVIGRIINQVCEVRITEIFPAYSMAETTKILSGQPQKLDKVITK